MKTSDWENVGNALRDPKKANEIHQLLIGMFPKQKRLLDYHYNEGRDSYPELKRFIHGIDKYILEGPFLVSPSDYKISDEAVKERERKYQQYIKDKAAGKDALYFRNNPADPREVDFSKFPPITIDENGEVTDGNHRAFLAQKANADLKAYKIIAQPNSHKNVAKILQLVGRVDWRKFLNESFTYDDVGRDNFVCPEIDPYGKAYYTINKNNPPSIEQLLKCWVENRGTIMESNVDSSDPVYYPTEELAPYREYVKDRLRRIKTGKYEELRADIKENGIREPLLIQFGSNGVAKIGEGNHRHQIAQELGLEQVPVYFLFQREVNLNENKWADYDAPKGQWLDIPIEDIASAARDRGGEINLADELYNLINNAYKKIGGHSNIRSASDLPGKYDEYIATDIDSDPEPDALRVSSNKPAGKKMTVAGHDGSKEAITAYIDKSAQLLNTPGYFSEMSKAIAHIMITKYGVPFVDSQEDVERVLGKEITWLGGHPEGKYPNYNGWYIRDIGGSKETKILLGLPKGVNE